MLKINVGKTEIISVTIGKRGASLNIGHKGTYVNSDILKTGLNYQEEINLAGACAMKASKINQLEKLEKLYLKENIFDSEYQKLRIDILGYAYLMEEIQRKGSLTSLGTLI